MRNHDDNGRSDQPAVLQYVCGSCTTAFHPNFDFCPNCDAPRPSEGWKSNRDVPDPWLGHIVDARYRLLQRLGKGTFGAVYRAQRPHLEDDYAVKVINLDHAEQPEDGPSLRERVEREVQILSSISSPHIVNFQDFAEFRGDTVAVVMDFVRGQTLGDLLNEDLQLDLSRAIQFAIEIATGLREVHQRGVVHRDLKPENVMVQSLGRRREFVEIIDFGVARFEKETRRTVGFIGTPRYTSPEQALGEDADQRSDIYNLGMLIYHMMTGEPPYTSNDVRELLAAHSREEAPRMSDTAPERSIPEPLQSLTQSMMSKSPDDRPDNMDAVLRALKPIRKEVEESKRSSSNLGADREKRDSLPPSFDTGVPGGFGSSHATNEYDSLEEQDAESEENVFAERPPSDVYTVTDQDRILYCDEDNNIRVRVARGGDSSERTLFSYSENVTAVACERPDWIVVGQENGRIVQTDLQSEDSEELFARPDAGAAASVATNPDGNRIVAGYEDGSVWFGSPEHAPADWASLEPGTSVVSVALHLDGSCIAVARDDATTDVYIPSRSHSPTTTVDHDEVPENIDFSPDGYLVAVRHADGNVQLFSALTGAHVSDSPRSVLQASSVFDNSSFDSDG